jgi:hypothetical protein
MSEFNVTISPLKTTSGIKASLVPVYDFSDIAWHNTGDLNYPKFKYFTELCVQVRDTFYIFDKAVGAWRGMADFKSTMRTLCQQYLGVQTIMGVQMALTQDDLKNFFTHGIVSFDGTVYAPGMGPFVFYQGQKRLNIYKDWRMAGDVDDIPETEQFLKVVRNSLCNAQDGKDLAAMVDELCSKEKTAFRWAMHWLAARYQMPGFTTQTNLWFLGIRGTGKGSLVQAMTALLGTAAVGKVSKEDMGRGWSDSLYGKELLEWDEFKSEKGWRDFGATIKEKTGNDTMQVSIRTLNSFSTPAVAMHLFTTNEDRPIQVEDTDRQNSFISTTEDKEVALTSKALFDPVTREFRNPKFLSGFAALLNELVVDIDFICSPFNTDKREELRAESEDTTTSWLEGYEPNTSFETWEDLHTEYKTWVSDHMNMRPEDIKSFKRKVRKAGRAEDAPRYVNGRSQRVAVFLKAGTHLTIVAAETTMEKFERMKAGIIANHRADQQSNQKV